MKLFEPFKLNNLLLKNRFFLSAAYSSPNDPFEKFEEIGLLISGGLRLEEIPHFEKTLKKVHAANGKMALQIVSPLGGRFGQEKDSIAVSVLTEDNPFFNPLVKYCKHHAATEEEIKKIIDLTKESALLAKSIGADAIEIHSAHQSFLAQFLSPLTNKRSDRWGGSLENRTRIHKAIHDAIRAKVGKNYPILIKLGVEDALEGGLKFSEGKKIAELIASFGYDALEISQGLQDFTKFFQGDWSGTPMRSEEAYFREWCKEIKKLVSIPVILQGGLKSYDMIEESLKNKEADLFGFCRSLIREPTLIHRWKTGNRERAKCISCNKCITELFLKGKPLECYIKLLTSTHF